MSFFFNDTATTEIYTLSLHDALPIFHMSAKARLCSLRRPSEPNTATPSFRVSRVSDCTRVSECTCEASSKRSEEHTSELQSRQYLVCRLLLEKKRHL